jgi:hypothetical protein
MVFLGVRRMEESVWMGRSVVLFCFGVCNSGLGVGCHSKVALRSTRQVICRV